MAYEIRCEYCGRVEILWDGGWDGEVSGPCGERCFQIFADLYKEKLLDFVEGDFVLPKRAQWRVMRLRVKYGILRKE